VVKPVIGKDPVHDEPRQSVSKDAIRLPIHQHMQDDASLGIHRAGLLAGVLRDPHSRHAVYTTPRKRTSIAVIVDPRLKKLISFFDAHALTLHG